MPQHDRTPNMAHAPSIAQVSAQWGISERTIRRRIADGTIRAYRMGPRIIRLHPDDVASAFQPIPTTAGGDVA